MDGLDYVIVNDNQMDTISWRINSKAAEVKSDSICQSYTQIKNGSRLTV